MWPLGLPGGLAGRPLWAAYAYMAGCVKRVPPWVTGAYALAEQTRGGDDDLEVRQVGGCRVGPDLD